MTILKLGKKNSGKISKIAAEAIKEGGVVICPTDTVYGLIAAATDKKAVEKIFKIKKRDKKKPVPIFVKDIKAAKKIAEINEGQEKLLKKVWPGKITAVLKLKNKNSIKIKNQKVKIFGILKKTVALRIPKSHVIKNLLSQTGLPLTGTSANISGKPESGNIKEIIRQFETEKVQPDLVIDAGNFKKPARNASHSDAGGSKPSTIIDLTSPEIKILRQGEVKIDVFKKR